MPRLIVIAALILLGAACSRTDLAYRNADRLLEHYAWRTVDPGSAQYERWEPVLQTTLRRHREQELPLVIAWLDLAAETVRETHRSPGAACLVDGALLLYQRHARLAVDLAVPLLATLDPGQVGHLAEYTSERRHDAIERYLDPDPQRQKAAREERVIRRIEKWTGELDNAQRRLVIDALEQIPDLSAHWLAYRTERTDTLLSMLESDAGADTLRTYLDNWWVHRGGTPADTRRQWRIARHEFIQLMDGLDTTLSETQRTRVENRIGDLREDLAAFLPRGQQPVDLHSVPACVSASS
jgi:hypothetical protein